MLHKMLYGITVVQRLFSLLLSPLHLNNVLNIPQKPLFVFQLCQSNFVSIEFFTWHFSGQGFKHRGDPTMWKE